MPVTLFQPILAPGSKAWVGSSKLCHSTASAAPCMTRHPLPKRAALMLVVVLLLAPVPLAVRLLVDVDQMMALVAWFETTRLPSAVSWSCVALRSASSAIGLSRFATQTGVVRGILLNHMARYQPGDAADDLLLMSSLPPPVAPGLMKPSANLPLLETSSSPKVSAWPGARVSSFPALLEGRLYRENRRRPRIMWMVVAMAALQA
ncbi:hypothetical protein BS78_06G052100 [Paspalum vaginatum]|nr:hypothetical protein BS78_06G052100 [Paspalum vaginatum]